MLTLRPDGLVVVAGGDQDNTTEFYNPASRSFGLDPSAPFIATDRDDYAPGDTVTFIGGQWQPGETVTIVLHEQPELHDDLTLQAVADENGDLINEDFMPEAHHLGVLFQVVATGSLSNATAYTSFTDAAPPSSAYSISVGTGLPSPGGVDVGIHCDDCATNVSTPFPITFYDTVFTNVTLSSNGVIRFGGGNFANPNFCLPSTVFPTFTVMPFWDDLRTDFPAGTGKGVFIQTTGTAPSRQFHVRWNVSLLGNRRPNSQVRRNSLPSSMRTRRVSTLSTAQAPAAAAR